MSALGWRKVIFALLMGTLVGVAAAAFVSSRQQTAADPHIPGLLWPEPKVLEPFGLVDQHGAPFTLDQVKGSWSFVFFGYTSCPDVCPTTLSALDKVARALQSDPEPGPPVQFVFISVDPSRDTLQRLGEYVAYFNAGFVGATAADDALSALTRQVGIGAERNPPNADGDYLVSHTSAVVLIDPRGRLIATFRAPHDPAEMRDRFRRIRHFIEG